MRPLRFGTPALLAASLLISGCSVIMAIEQPEKKDLSLVRVGNSSGLLLAEFGGLISNKPTVDGGSIQTYKFRQGYPGWTRGLRATGHLAGDIFTLCLWELAGTPIELGFNGKDIVFEVVCDKDNTVTKVNFMKD